MKTINRIKIDNETSVIIDAADEIIVDEDYEPGVTETGFIDDLKEKAIKIVDLPDKTIELISKSIARFSKNIITTIKQEFDNDYTNIDIEYGIKLLGEAGIKVVNVSGEANMIVRIGLNRNQ